MTARFGESRQNSSRTPIVAFLLTAFCLWGTGIVKAQSTSAPAAAVGLDQQGWLKDVSAWRAQREKEIDAPDGWLTLVGLEWLKPGVNTVGAAADNQIRIAAHAPDHVGVFSVSGDGVQFAAPASGFPADLQLDGQAPHEGPLKIDDLTPSVLTWHGLSLIVLNRAGRFVLRIKDAGAPTRTAFHGLNWYAPDPAFRVEARWIPYTPARIEKIPTVLGNTLDLPSPGVAEFTLYGKTLRLEPVLEDPHGKTLFFILRDQTRYDTTYQAARFLHTEFPDHGLGQPGRLTLDFNRLENPPCAYTPYATCPLPPEFNRLLIRIEAGEKRYSP